MKYIDIQKVNFLSLKIRRYLSVVRVSWWALVMGACATGYIKNIYMAEGAVAIDIKNFSSGYFINFDEDDVFAYFLHAKSRIRKKKRIHN